MNFKLLFSIFLVIFALNGCSTGYGNKLTGEGLTVFFNDENDEQLATDIAFFWKDSEFLGQNKQFIRLFNENKRYQLQIIPTSSDILSSLTIEEKIVLVKLQDTLNNSLFKNTFPCDIVFCTKDFEPIAKLNKIL